MISIRDIIATVERIAPLELQESWDNSGVQVGDTSLPCTGVTLCVDCTPEIVDEAATSGHNLIVAHHPLIFKPLKSLTGATPAEVTVIDALRRGICVYSAHTSLDCAEGGISKVMSGMLGLTGVVALEPNGLGAIGQLPEPLTPLQLAALARDIFGCEAVRVASAWCDAPDNRTISRVALCGGAGGSLIRSAVDAGAQAYITGDLRHHDFVDFAPWLFMIDVGHFDSEKCARSILYNAITEIFPNFAVSIAKNERNPIKYL